LSIAANAQDIVVNKLRSETARQIKKDADTTKWNWKRGGLISANLSQGSLSNWAAGGDNFSMSLSSYFNYYFYYLKGRNSWDNNLDVNLGFVQSTSLGTRKMMIVLITYLNTVIKLILLNLLNGMLLPYLI